MHFGQHQTKRKLTAVCVMFMAVIAFSCKREKGSTAVGFKFPEQGKEISLGQDVKIELDVPSGTSIHSATYLLDGKVIGAKNGAEVFILKTGNLGLGYRLISAVVDNGKQKDTLTVNIVLKSAIVPSLFSYKIIHAFPHDTSSYTQGLEYHEGKFLESTGEYGSSTLRWVDVKSGKALQKIDIDKKYFGEGSALVGDKVILLTWQENTGFVYDAKTFQQIAAFAYQNSREGWGLTFNGKQLIKSDGTNRIWFLNKDHYKEENFIEVFDHNGPVDQLNELEYIDGKIYANIYQTDKIAIINPQSGAVESYIDLTGILPAQDRYPNTDVLNGIAWDAKGKRLFVTGKKYSKLFQIDLVPKK